MCGIAGIVGPGAGDRQHVVEAMLHAMHHRGPDADGVWATDDAVLGCARLAVVDPRHGAQPIRSAGDDVIVVGNGEIYGHRSVRARFPSHPYRSGSDMEVTIPLWDRHGTDLPEHLPGTFALALYDRRRSQLVLTRDAFGERPLYWVATDGCVAFASDPSALLAVGLAARRIDVTVLGEMVRLGYVPPGECIWDGVHAVAPGRTVVFDGGTTTPVVTRWWRAPTSRPDRSMAEAAQWLATELDRAVAEQLEADIPVGLFVSGGLDSSAVAAAAARHRPGIVAFSSDLPVGSEAAWATAVADRHGLDLRLCVPDESDLAATLVRASAAWSEPFGDSSSVLTYLLAERAREEVGVVLTGDGADELLGGYAVWARDALAAAGPPGAGRRWRRARRATSEGSPVARAYRSYRSAFTAEELVRLGLPASSPDEVDVSAYRWGDVEDLCRFDLDWYLPGDILVKTDRASMAHSLEVRAPFLDRVVAEGCLTLPAHLKVDDRHEKLVLREAVAGSLPAGLADRPKQGFGAPLDRWLGRPDVGALLAELLDPSRGAIGALLDPSEVARHVATGGQPAWTLLMVGLWWSHHGAAVAA